MFSPSTDKLLKEYMRAMFMHTLYRLTTLNTELISIRVFFLLFQNFFAPNSSRKKRLERLFPLNDGTKSSISRKASYVVISTCYRFKLLL